MRVLREASLLVSKGKVKAQSEFWFGDRSDVWMKSMGRSLNQLASILNTKPIKVRGTNWKEREATTSAASYAPRDGWNRYTSVKDAEGQNFHMDLDIAWNAKPLFRPGNTPALSKFHTVVHELTHLILSTNDESPAYGVDNCRNKANNNPGKAKTNADNWAFFVDDMRKPVFPPAVTSKDWQELTARKMHTRSAALKRLDSALDAYEKLANPANGLELNNAFTDWYTKNPNERAARNKNSVVDHLKAYVASV